MTNTIRRITGNIAELRYQSASELPPGAAGFTQSLRRYAPILAALSGNGGIAVSAQGQNMDWMMRSGKSVLKARISNGKGKKIAQRRDPSWLLSKCTIQTRAAGFPEFAYPRVMTRR